jgi:hypothetical protein
VSTARLRADRVAPHARASVRPPSSSLRSCSTLLPAPQPVKYDKTEQQLHSLLMTMVEDEKLEYVAGQFKLKA